MGGIQQRQLQRIYAMGNKLGMVAKGNDREDDLHTLVACVTGKESIKALSFGEAGAVIAELQKRAAGAAIAPTANAKKRTHKTTPGGMSQEQQCKAWALLYELEKHDPTKGNADVGTRMVGLIKRQFGMDAALAQPFRFLSSAQGRALIETLKDMAEKAELKAIHKGGLRHG